MIDIFHRWGASPKLYMTIIDNELNPITEPIELSVNDALMLAETLLIRVNVLRSIYKQEDLK